jgi:uncharacterized membrane protein
MSTSTILIIAAVFIAGLGLGAFIIWAMLRRNKPSTIADKAAVFKSAVETSAQATGTLAFRWSYVVAPLTLSVVCIIIAASFAAFLPNPIAFRFMSNGAARMSTNTYSFIVLMLLAQVICALAAWGIAGTIVHLGHNSFKTSAPQLPLSGYITLMTNMVLLPQLILAYIMLDAFIYGTWARHLISVGLFSILTIAIGSLVLIFMFARMLSRAQNIISKN